MAAATAFSGQVALEAPLGNRKAQLAFIYDRLVRKDWAEKSTQAHSGFNITKSAKRLGAGILRAAEVE